LWILFDISNDPIEVHLIPDHMLVVVAMPDGRPGRLEQVVDLSRADGLEVLDDRRERARFAAQSLGCGE
jgi:hypothetical protein